MVQSTDEYPFWARWAKRINNTIVPITDITSVTTEVKVYNSTTNVFDLVSSSTLSAPDSDGRWVRPFTIPSASGYKKYVCIFTPVGGSHQSLQDEVDTLDGLLTSVEGGFGTETHTGVVCAPDGTPLSGVLVKAVPHGTLHTWASTTTNGLGEYTLTGLVANHAYQIYYNKDGYWGKTSEVVIA